MVYNMVPLEDQLCPWEVSKQIPHLKAPFNSWFHWVHPWQSNGYIENPTKYIVAEWASVCGRKSYPAYMTMELLLLLPEVYVLGRSHNKWYCKETTDGWSDVVYYTNPAEACAHCYINIIKEKEGNI